MLTRCATPRGATPDPDEAAALSAIGVDLVPGDIVDAADVTRAAQGCDTAIHCAALLGGASQNLTDFQAVNVTAHEVRTPRSAKNPTRERLGYQPMSFDEGITLLIRTTVSPDSMRG